MSGRQPYRQLELHEKYGEFFMTHLLTLGVLALIISSYQGLSFAWLQMN